MARPPLRAPLSVDAMLVGYAMSRLDRSFLTHFGFASWKHAYRAFGSSLKVNPNSLKNLRDEFDPLHANSRAGWRHRPLRSNRYFIHEAMSEISDAELLTLVATFLADDSLPSRVPRTTPVAGAATAAANRLRTGREAEAVVVRRSEEILGVGSHDLLDMRDALCGFDFRALRREPPWLLEVKGLRGDRGKLRFTRLEWLVARRAGPHYALVVVHSLDASPGWEVIPDPARRFPSAMRVEQQQTIAWEVRFPQT